MKKKIKLNAKTMLAAIAIALLLTASLGGAYGLVMAQEEGTATVLRGAYLRSGPGITFRIAGGASAGQEIELVAQNADGSWYQLANGNWIAAFLVGDAPEDLAVVSDAYANRNANLRGGPGTNHEIVGVVAQGDILQIVGVNEAGTWYELAEGEWIAAFLVENTPDLTSPPEPTATNTPEPTATPEPTEAPAAPEPQVTVPCNFTKIVDAERGYSLALPSSWAELDLRGAQVTNLANLVGQGEALAELQAFLETDAGQGVGTVAITDIGAAMFGGLPTGLNVSVVDAPGATAESVRNFMESVLEANAAQLGDVSVGDIEVGTTNNLPSVNSTAVANLANVGVNASVFAKVVSLVANDKLYTLTLVTPENNMARYEEVFEQIIGTFGPE